MACNMCQKFLQYFTAECTAPSILTLELELSSRSGHSCLLIGWVRLQLYFLISTICTLTGWMRFVALIWTGKKAQE